MGFLRIVLDNIRNMKRAKKFRNMDIADLLALENEELYDAVECVCYDAVVEITDPALTEAQVFVYSLIQLEMEVNNGGLCQFFVNSSSECAPYISKALDAIGADKAKSLYDSFILDNHIDVNDLSSFKIESIEEYEAQTERFDFDSFDDAFYEDEDFHQQIIDYARKNIEQIMK